MYWPFRERCVRGQATPPPPPPPPPDPHDYPPQALDRLPFFLKVSVTEKNKKVVYRGEAAKEPLLHGLEARRNSGDLVFDDNRDATTFQFMFTDSENARLSALTEALLEGVQTSTKRRVGKSAAASSAASAPPAAKHKKNKKTIDEGDGFDDLF